MVRIGATEFLEGTEEMVMPGITLGRDKTAHGEGVDQRIVELLVLIDGRGRNRILAASRRIARHALQLGEAARRGSTQSLSSIAFPISVSANTALCR
jgi:hypothetical protein